MQTVLILAGEIGNVTHSRCRLRAACGVLRQAVGLLTVRSSNLCQTAAALTEVFRALSQTLQANTGRSTTVKLCPPPSKSFPTHDSPGQTVTGCDAI
jgi:hypothetical protein